MITGLICAIGVYFATTWGDFRTAPSPSSAPHANVVQATYVLMYALLTVACYLVLTAVVWQIGSWPAALGFATGAFIMLYGFKPIQQVAPGAIKRFTDYTRAVEENKKRSVETPPAVLLDEVQVSQLAFALLLVVFFCVTTFVFWQIGGWILSMGFSIGMFGGMCLTNPARQFAKAVCGRHKNVANS